MGCLSKCVCSCSSITDMASFRGFEDVDNGDDEGSISNGLEPREHVEDDPESKAIGIYRERRSAKASQRGGIGRTWPKIQKVICKKRYFHKSS